VTLRTLPAPLRVLFSCFLITMGLGYLAAGALLFLGTIDPHQEMGMGLVRAVAAKYYGERSNSRLESALRGTMSARVGAEGRETIVAWVRGGAPREGFDKVQAVLERSCAACHSPKSGLPVPPLTSFDEVAKLAQVDTGPTLAELARVSHVHLFGISFIFLLTGGIFALSETAPGWRAMLLALPYLTIWADIGAWWVTKYEPAFASIVVFSGALMGLALALQIFIPLWEMWLGRRPAPMTGGKA
jgi:hypothetical protein